MSSINNNNNNNVNNIGSWSENVLGFCGLPAVYGGGPGAPPLRYQLVDNITPNTDQQLQAVAINAVGDRFAVAFSSISGNNVSAIDIYILNSNTGVFTRIQSLIPTPNIASTSPSPIVNTPTGTGTGGNMISLAFSALGNFLILGMPNNSTTGVAIIYEYNGSQYVVSPGGTILNTTAGSSGLGQAVSISSDGNICAIGIPQFTGTQFLGSVLVYQNIPQNSGTVNNWVLEQQLFQARQNTTDQTGFGRSISLDEMGNTIVVGSSNAAIVYRNERANNPPISVLTQLVGGNSTGANNQGTAVYITPDASTIAVLSNAGSNSLQKIPVIVWLYTRNNASNSNGSSLYFENGRITPNYQNLQNNRTGIPSLSALLMLSNDANFVIFSDPNFTQGNSTVDGSLFSFQRSIFGLRQIKQLTTGESNGYLGTSGGINFNIDKLLVAAPNISVPLGSGKGYLYQ